MSSIRCLGVVPLILYGSENQPHMPTSIERVPDTFHDFLSYVRNHTAPVYIFGADIAGKVTAKMLKKHGVEIAGFLDNNRNKCMNAINGVAVSHASRLASMDQDAVILIASTYIADIINQIEGMGFYKWVPIADIIEANRHEDFRAMLSGSEQQNHAGGEFTKDFIDFAVSNMVNSQKKYLDPARLFIRSVDLILTEKCSLNCKDCSNLMQYYDNPVNIGGEELFGDLEDICAIADEINEIRIIGGEPLMNKDFHLITKKAAEYPNVNKVVIYTNGTICPPEEKIQAMNDDKIFVFVTTYGDLSRNESKLTAMLDKHGIQYNNQAAYGWTDCASIQTWNRNEETNKTIFRNCCAKHFTTLTDGKVFRCPFSANVERLRAIPDVPSDYISIRGAAKDNKEHLGQLKQRIRWFLREKPILAACDSCNGRTYGDPEITPGLQTRETLAYVKYAR